MPQRIPRTFAAAAALTLVVALAACDRTETAPPASEPTLGQSIDRSTEQAGQAAREAGAAIGQAGEAAADTARDAAITTQVNAKLVADDQLSALKIDVDTVDGRVALVGTAPDTAARERASQLAATVDGVVAVDNRLLVEPRS